MAARPVRALALLAFVLLPAVVSAQVGAGAPVDPLGLTQLKDFGAWRSSSNHADPDSNDDSKRPHARRDGGARRPAGAGRGHAHVDHGRGQRVRLAAPAAAARLLRRQPEPSVDAPLGDFFARRSRLRAAGQLAAGPRQLQRPLAQQLLADALRALVPDHDHQRGTIGGCRTSTTTWTGRSCRRCRRTPPTSTRGTDRRCRPRRGGPTRCSLCRDAGTTSAPCSASSRTSRGGSARATSGSTWTGTRPPRIEGTGTEDYFNDAWSLRVAERPVRRRAGGRGDRPRRADDGVPLAHRRPDPLHAVTAVRLRARRLDLQRRWLGAVGV